MSAALAAAAAAADCFATSAHRNSNTSLQLPIAAVPADAYRCYSTFLAAAAAPVAADVAADPVHAAPPAAMAPCLLHPLMLRNDVSIRGGDFRLLLMTFFIRLVWPERHGTSLVLLLRQRHSAGQGCLVATS